MRRTSSIIYILLPILMNSCDVNFNSIPCTKNVSLETLAIQVNTYGDEHYCIHRVWVKGYCKESKDKIDLTKLAYQYMDTVQKCPRIGGISFFSSDENFRRWEMSQNWEAVRKNSIVDLFFSSDSMINNKPVLDWVIFYESGEPTKIRINPSVK